jgi:hypothetical protein
MLVSLEAGYRLGRRKRKALKDEDLVGSNVAITSIFAIVGLILAFTYSYTVSRADMRKQLVVQEANAISTAFLRASLVPDPGSTELKMALLDYARSRVIKREHFSSREGVREFLSRTLQLQAKLWPITEHIAKSNTPGPIEALLVAAINEVLDAHTARAAGGVDRLPSGILLMILLISAAALAVAAFSSGLHGRFSRWRMTALALAIAIVLSIILDFDYPTQGFIRVTQQPLQSAIAAMDEANLANKQ